MTLRSLLKDNIGLKLLSVVLALAAWFVAQGEQVHRVTVDVAVEYIFPGPTEENPDATPLVLMNESLPEQFTLHVSGTRVAISRFVTQQLKSHTVDLQEAEAGTTVRSFRVLPGDLGGDLILDMVSPSEVRIVFDEVDSVTVPVRIRRRGELATDLKELDSHVDPEQVTLTGSRKDLATVEFVETVALRMGELKAGLNPKTVQLELAHLHLLADSPREVAVAVIVEKEFGVVRFDSVRVGLSEQMSGFEITPGRCAVVVKGSPDTVKSLEAGEIQVVLSGTAARLDFSGGNTSSVSSSRSGTVEPEVPSVRVIVDHEFADSLEITTEPSVFVVSPAQLVEDSLEPPGTPED